jgi:N6-adenosine-specific RNA methylase IME4
LVGSATFTICTEYVVYARRGNLPSASRVDRNWFEWPRSNSHSRKPDAFLDLVEQISPGPYLELFARRQRLGWDTWGDEAFDHTNGALSHKAAKAHGTAVPECDGHGGTRGVA